jgi:hypothetical protein
MLLLAQELAQSVGLDGLGYPTDLSTSAIELPVSTLYRINHSTIPSTPMAASYLAAIPATYYQ